KLAPAETEPAVTHHQAVLAGGELARHGLHAEGTATRHDDGGMRLVHALERAADIVHGTLEQARHVIDRSVGINHGIFKQTVGIDVGTQAGHGTLQWKASNSDY